MPKHELIRCRQALYELSSLIGASLIGTQAELNPNIELTEAYDYLSRAIDCLENYGYDKNWINIETNEVTEE